MNLSEKIRMTSFMPTSGLVADSTVWKARTKIFHGINDQVGCPAEGFSRNSMHLLPNIRWAIWEKKLSFRFWRLSSNEEPK